MDHIQKFSYLPLDLSATAIRLIVLQPCRDPSADIECDIIHTESKERPQYEALSYTWGNENQTKAIYIRNQVYHVTENLWMALRRLRQTYEARVLWIDAICINQNDKKERNHQVNQMSIIYGQAERVVVWLGVETTDSRVAINFLYELDTIHIRRRRRQYYRRRVHADQWHALKDLCEREYWSRLWIVQEVILASDLRVYCGVDEINWNIFSDICSDMGRYRDPELLQIGQTMTQIAQSIPARLAKYCAQTRWHIWPIPGQKQTVHFPLLDLFSTFHEAECRDYKDKIFGLRRKLL